MIMKTIIKKAPAVEAEAIETSKKIIPVKEEIVKTDADIDGFIELRTDFIRKVNAICVEGKDYHMIQGKKSLAKGGAEKIASIFKWTAKFDKDTEALEMLGNITGLVAFKCTLMNGQFVGEGRGAASLAKNNGDPNKTLKMAQKSAFIDAVLRASGLSDFFTQDLEDMPRQEIGQPQNYSKPYIPPAPKMVNGKPIYDTKPSKKPTERQTVLIKKLCSQKKINQTQLTEMAKGLTPSELIDKLIKYQASAQEEVPVIQQEEMTEEEKILVDSIPF